MNDSMGIEGDFPKFSMGEFNGGTLRYFYIFRNEQKFFQNFITRSFGSIR